MPVRTRVAFEGDKATPVGQERIRLLEAVAETGSISAAARATGITYKAAWDALDALNNLFGHPLVETRTGGKRGGGAALTEKGIRLIETFHRLEKELTHLFQKREPELSGSGISTTDLLWSFLMKTSARNVLRCTVLSITEGAVNAEIILQLSEKAQLHAVITRDSVHELGLAPGRETLALIKASFIILAPLGEVGRTSARNRIEGVIRRCEAGPVNTEISLDIGGEKTLTAVITTSGAQELGFQTGTPAVALIDAAHILLAVN